MYGGKRVAHGVQSSKARKILTHQARRIPGQVELTGPTMSRRDLPNTMQGTRGGKPKRPT